MGPLKIGIIGDFNPDYPSHAATNEAIGHAAAALGALAHVHWLPTPTIEKDPAPVLEPFDALWCSPGSPYQSQEGALDAIRFARERDYPFLGT